MANRQHALNCWIQGVVIIWQSVAPSRPRAAYAIGELLEAFLCSPDSESFYKVLEDVKNEEKTASDQEPEIEATLPALAEISRDAPPPESPFVSHVAAADKSRTTSWSSQNGSQQQSGMPRSSSTNSFAQVAQQNRRRSKRASGTNAIAEDQASSFSDVVSLQRDKVDAPNYEEREKISKSAPPEPVPSYLAASAPAYLPDWAPNTEFVPPAVPSVGAVGIAINMISSSSPSAQKQRTEYVTFNTQGERVRNSFHPFVAKVMFGEGPEGREEVARTSGTAEACTPVSVPPTPHALNQFNAQWNQYTSSVLEFVQERLSIVSKNNRDFNILDRHRTDNGSNHFSDNEDDDGEAFGVGGSSKPMIVINLRDKGRSVRHSDNSEPVEDADAGAGGSAQGGQVPPKHALAASYVIAGEHLIKTILREAEADIADWQFVSNTKDVIVMRRLRPIKKRNLLKVRGPSVQQPSPSPTISEERTRVNVALAPSMLVLDGTASAASSMASPQRELGAPADAEISQHCFMGRGIIDASPEEIFELVRRPEKRHFYDAMLNEELLLENLAVGESAHDFEKSGMGNLLVYYHLFETNRCFLRYARDFCVVQYAKKVMVGKTTKYVVVGASINHAQCPVREDVERATLDLFGWVVEPTTKPNQSKVTYMMHIDFGRSGVPTHLLNTISFRQPLAVHYLRKHIQNTPPEERV